MATRGMPQQKMQRKSLQWFHNNCETLQSLKVWRWDCEVTCRSQYAFISLLRGVCLLILNWTTEPSCPATLRLM